VATVHRVLNQVNLFVEISLRVGEFIRNKVLTARLANHVTPRVDMRTHFHPPCKEVAAILLDDSMGAERDVILHQKGGRLQQINEGQPACNPVHFPLLFQHGELDWHLAARHQGDTASRNANRVACREYNADRLNIKVKGYSVLRRAARLFLRKVYTLPKCVCLDCRDKNLRHVNTESRIK